MWESMPTPRVFESLRTNSTCTLLLRERNRWKLLAS
jgi:hypothetical protein